MSKKAKYKLVPKDTEYKVKFVKVIRTSVKNTWVDDIIGKIVPVVANIDSVGGEQFYHALNPRVPFGIISVEDTEESTQEKAIKQIPLDYDGNVRFYTNTICKKE